MSETRKIIHVDMDCFYAAVEVKYRPELKNKPVGVGGPPDSRSVLMTASYEARKFGVRSAMPSSRAVRLCPQLILVPPNFTLYKKESQAAREIFYQYTDKVEPLSLDEAYLDVTQSTHHGGSATLIAKEIRARIEKELNLTASAGIAPNKFLAKIASDWKKPNGQFVIRPQDVAAFMPPLKIEKIHGVGKVTAKKMHDLGFFTCAELQNAAVDDLQRHFGSWARRLHELAHGRDNREVDSSSERKSMTVEETFNTDLKTYKEWENELAIIYQDWDGRMRRMKSESQIRGHVVKVKFADFQTMTREMASTEWPTLENFKVLLKRVWEQRAEPIRLLGVGVRMGSTTKDGESEGESDDGQMSLLMGEN